MWQLRESQELVIAFDLPMVFDVSQFALCYKVFTGAFAYSNVLLGAGFGAFPTGNAFAGTREESIQLVGSSPCFLRQGHLQMHLSVPGNFWRIHQRVGP
jgi:hypothetical protein